MAISIFLAKSARHLDQAFRVRHTVYVEEEKRFEPTKDGRIFDRFDAFPRTYSIVAVDTGKPGSPAVGTMRFAVQGESGLPCDDFYDFTDFTKDLEGGIATIGMLAVKRRYRFSRGLLPGMVKVAWRALKKAGARHVVAPVSPDAEIILRSMGAKEVGEPFDYGDPPVRMTPLWLDMEDMSPVFREMSVDPQNILFDEIDERRLYRQRAKVFSEGERGDEAFLIMRGTVRVFSGDASDPKTMYLLGPGEVIGELALLDAGEHPVTVQVHSKLADLAVIPRDAFQARLTSDTVFAQRMLRVLGERLRRLLLNLPPEQMQDVNQEAVLAGVLLEGSEHGTRPVERGWLAAECGLKAAQLEEVIQPWFAAGALERDGDKRIRVTEPTTLRVIIDHVVDAAALP